MAMTNGGGKHTVYTAVDSDGAVSPLALLYHYDPDTTDTANIYSDQALTAALAQPFVADAAGRFVFYASGDFDFVIKDADSVTLDTWDDVHISMGQALVNDWGTSYPSSGTGYQKGHMFAKIISSIVRSVGINYNGNAYSEIFQANADGDQVLPILLSQKSPYNVKAYSAKGDSLSDDTSAIQAVINTMPSTGGIIYFPIGTYIVDSASLTITGKSITFMGDGTGLSIIKTTVNTLANGVIDFNASSIKNKFGWKDLDLVTSYGGALEGINCSWPSTAGTTNLSNFYMENAYVGADPQTLSTSDFITNITLSDGKKPTFRNVTVNARNTAPTFGMTGIKLTGNTRYVDITGCRFNYLGTGILMSAGIDDVKILGCDFRSSDNGIASSGTAPTNFVISNNTMLDIYTDGILLSTLTTQVTISGNTIELSSSATATRSGISITGQSYTITGNTVIDAGASGTSYGILTNATSTRGTIDGNNTESLTYGIFMLTTTATVVTNNHDEASDVAITDSNSGATNYIENNYPTTFAVTPSGTALGAGGPQRVSNLWDVSGTTTVTSISADANPWVDRIITLKFSGILTFTDGSNLNLAGDFVTSADDTITLAYDGTTWNETSRSAN